MEIKYAKWYYWLEAAELPASPYEALSSYFPCTQLLAVDAYDDARIKALLSH